VGCNTQQKTEELIQARLDAERMKTLETETTELKSKNEELAKENAELKLEVTSLEAKLAAQAAAAPKIAANPKPKVAAAQPAKRPGKSQASTSKASPAEIEQLHDQLTGGSSFK
jgi:regulator of replication initiation timing